MPSLNLDILSPSVREKILGMKINQNYDSGENPIRYNNFTPIDDTPNLEEYKPNILEYTDENTFEKQSKLHLAARFKIRDSWQGAIHRDGYPKQWDNRSMLHRNDRIPEIYRNIEEPNPVLTGLQTDRHPYSSYIDYVNSILGKSIPTSADSGTINSSSTTNILASLVMGEGLGFAINPYDHGIKVVSDFDWRQTLGGRIVSQLSGKETPMAKFGLKAAAISMANQMMAKTGRFASGGIQEGTRWILNNSVGRLFGADTEFNINAFGSGRITNPPGIADDILNITGANKVINRGLDELPFGIGDMIGGNWSQTATSTNDGKYVQLDDDLLANTLSNRQPDFNAFVDPQGMKGRAFAKGEEPGFFKRMFGNKRIERETVNEWEYRRLQQDVLVDWTGAMNSQMLFSLLELNKYSPGYTKKSSRKEARKGDPLPQKGYHNIFPDNQYVNPSYKGLPTIAENIDPIKDRMSNFTKSTWSIEGKEGEKKKIEQIYKYNTITWGENEITTVKYGNQYNEEDIPENKTVTNEQSTPKWKEKLGEKFNQIGGKIRKPFQKRENSVTQEADKYGLKFYKGVQFYDINETDTLLGKTAKLFAENKIGTMVSRFHKSDEQPSFIQSAVHPVFGMSKGRALANAGFASKTDKGYIDPWCRVWTAETQYRNILNAIRPFVVEDEEDPGNSGIAIDLKELHEKAAIIRPYIDQFTQLTSLQQSGTPKIAPYRSDFKKGGTNKLADNWSGNKADRWKYNRNYMFSIENLAWKSNNFDLEDVLCPSQIGPNGGRIFWFSPLNLKFTEDVTTTIQPETFIGRSEPMYSFRGNTVRKGKLDFTIIVDHSSFHEYMRDRKSGDSEQFKQLVLRFDAGCEIPTIIDKKDKECKQKIITNDRVIEMNDTLKPDKRDTIQSEVIDLVTVYYPNDFSGVSWHTYKDENPEIKDLKAKATVNAGQKIMNYLYLGAGSTPEGNEPYIPGIGGDKSFGYEMKTTGESNVSISNNKIPKNEGKYEMVSFNDGGGSVEGISHTTKNLNKNIYGGTNENFIKNFNRNMHVTDKIVPYYEISYNKANKIVPKERNEVLPRFQYRSFLSNWDIGNFNLNSNKDKDMFSFGRFYEICNDIPDGKHKDEETNFSEKINEIFRHQEGFKEEGREPTLKEKLKYLFENAEKIEVLGNASADGYSSDNQKLGRYRAVSLALFIIETLNLNLEKSDTNPNPPEWVIKSEVLTEVAKHELNIASSKPAKKFRHAHVIIHTRGSEKITEKSGVINTEQTDTTQIDEYTLTAKSSRYDEEADFYEYIGNRGETDLTWTNIKDRYNKYIPALWSCTPEGFNARLTFLHQCTRSGPTNAAGENAGGVSNIANLAFGRPPVCILRIGDFIQSKIFIDTISMSYGDEGIQWDLNPEGIGIQPMIVNVGMGITFMGGQDITGAIARLQNAVSFNYYANTSVYDDRADGNHIDLKEGMDTSRIRGMTYDLKGSSGKKASTKTREEIKIEGESVSTKRSQDFSGWENAELKTSVEDMNKEIGGLFNPYTYMNGNTYFDINKCKDIDKTVYNPPTDGKGSKITNDRDLRRDYERENRLTPIEPLPAKQIETRKTELDKNLHYPQNTNPNN